MHKLVYTAAVDLVKVEQILQRCDPQGLASPEAFCKQIACLFDDSTIPPSDHSTLRRSDYATIRLFKFSPLSLGKLEN